MISREDEEYLALVADRIRRDREYIPPTNEEMQALLDRWGLHPNDAARRLNITRRTVDRYCNDPASLCPYPALYTLANMMTGKRIGLDWRERLL